MASFASAVGRILRVARGGALLAACVASLAALGGRPVAPVGAAADDAAQIVELTNVERQKAGLPPLVANLELEAAARSYAGVLAGGECWAHTCGPEPDFAKRAQAAGYSGWTTLGENLAAGQRSPESAVAAWMESPAHRANILNPAFAEIGVGTALGGRMGIYWTQEFGARRTAPALAADGAGA
jgi:uncharacterized protein YkwD